MSTHTKIKARLVHDTHSTAAGAASGVQRVDESIAASASGVGEASTLSPRSPLIAAADTGSGGTPQPNEAPVVVDEWITVKAGQSVSAHQSVLLGNDRDNDGGTLSITEFGNPSHGTLTKAADGTLTYVANGNYSGDDSFTYKVSDGQGGFTTGTVHIKVESCGGSNKPPVVVDEWASVRGTNPVSAHESVLLANDSDPEGGALSVRNFGKPAHGTLTRAADGTLTYKADAGFSGTDTFTYEVVDPQGNVTVGTVHLCVLPATLSVTITDVRDDVGAVQGTVVDEGRTDDRRPALQGTTEANALVDVYDGTTKLGQVKADGTGHWSFTPTTDLGDGRHDFKAVATAIDGQTAQSNEWSVTVDCGTTPPPPPPPPPALPAPVVAIGEDLNNDGVINKAEKTGPADAIVTLPLGAKAGDTLIVTDQSGAKQEKLLSAADIAAGKVSFVDGFAMPAEGQTLTLTAQIRTVEGVMSEKGTDSAVIDTTAPGNPIVTITTDSDNNGRINQGELNAAGGVDVKIDLPDTAKAGDKLIVVDQAGNKVEVTLTAAQIAAKSVTLDNAFPTPAHNATLTVTATLADPAGNVSGPGSDSAIIDCPPPPPPPPTVPAPVVTIANDSNNDGLLNKTEAQGRADIVVDLALSVKAGDFVYIEDQTGNLIGRKLTVEEAAAHQIIFTDAFAFPAEGQTLKVESYIRTAEGALSPRANDQAVVDTTGPGNPTITIETDGNNDGKISKAEFTSAGGNDLRVGLPATAKAGDILTVTDQDGHLIQRPLTAAEVAAGSVFLDNAFPSPGDGKTLTVKATITDPAGNVSDTAQDSAVMTLTAPSVTVTIMDDKNNDGVITRSELNNATRVDVRLDLPASVQVGDKLEVTDNQGNGLSKTVTAADVAAGQITFLDAFPLPAPGQAIEVTAKVTDALGNVSVPSSDSALLENPPPNQPPVGTDDDNTVQANAIPVAKFFAMNQNSGAPEGGGQTWVTTDGDAGRAVYGSLSSLLTAGMKVQVSSSDRPGQWLDAVVSSDGLHWTAVDTAAHTANWTYGARVIDALGSVLSESAVQQVQLLPGAPIIESFGAAAGDASIAVGSETTDQTLVINGRAADGAASAGHTIEVFANGLGHSVGTAVVKADGSWSLDLTGTPLRDGDYSFYARDNTAQSDWSQAAALQLSPPPVSLVNWENWGKPQVFMSDSSHVMATPMGGVRVDLDGSAELMNKSYIWNPTEAIAPFIVPTGSTTVPYTYLVQLSAYAGSRFSTGASLSFEKPIENLDLLITVSGTTTILAWDADGNPVAPKLIVLGADGYSPPVLEGNKLSNSGEYGYGSYSVLQFQGSYSRIQLVTDGAAQFTIGTHASRPGLDAGVDDGSITPVLAQGIGAGADVLSYATQSALDQAIAARQADGSAGIDTLRMTGSGMVLNLTDYSSVPGTLQQVQNLEKFDLSSGGNRLVMSVNDVLAQGQTNAFVANGRTQVMVLGGGADSLNLTALVGHGGDSGTWVAAGTVLVDGVNYNVYNHSSLAAQVLVKPGLQVELPAAPGTPAKTAAGAEVQGQVLTNDNDPDGPKDQLRVAGVDNNATVTQGENLGQRIEGQWGHLTLGADGRYTYVADKTQALTSAQDDVFYYRLVDEQGLLSAEPTKLTIHVQPAVGSVTSVSNAQTVEGGDLVFTVETALVAQPTTMQLKLQSGSATVGVDTNGPLQVNFGKGWVDVVDNQVTVPANTTSYQVRTHTVDDVQIESQEKVTLSVSSSTAVTLQGTGTILDNDLKDSAVQGTEDTPLALSWSSFNLQAAPTATSVKITTLPADGTLQFNDNGTWRAVGLNQQFSKAEVDAGKLRFTPDAHESGVDAYGLTEVGNKLNDYAKVGFTALDAHGQAFNEAKLTIDIKPIADLGTLSVQAIQPPQGSAASDHVYRFHVSGSSPDMDGSERIRIAVKLTSGSGVQIIDGDTGFSRVATPDADGVYWLDPDDQIHVFVVFGVYTSGFSYALYREDVNKDGVVLHEAHTPFKETSFYGTPLILDLNGDGVQTASIDHGVTFDLNGDGKKEHTGWTDGKDGLLVLDRNGNGRIDSGAELFGDATQLRSGDKAKDGFAALADLDSNGDGVIDAGDSQFANLQVWVDSNQDGQTQAGELVGLGAVGVVSLNLHAEHTEVVQNGNIIGLTSSYTKADGSTHELSDVWFQTRDLNEASDATLNAKDLLVSDAPLAELCSGDPKGCSVAIDPDVEAQLASHAMPHRVSFERWEEPSHAML